MAAVTAEAGGANPVAPAACWPVPPTAGVEESSAREEAVSAAATGLGATAPLAAADIATAAGVGATGLSLGGGAILADEVAPSLAALTWELAAFGCMSLSAVAPLRVFGADEPGADSETWPAPGFVIA